MEQKHEKKLTMFITIAFITLLIVAVGGVLVLNRNNGSLDSVKDFESCVAAGGAILESYPEQCVAPGSKQNFTKQY